MIQNDLIIFLEFTQKNMNIHSKTNIQCLYGFAVRRTPTTKKPTAAAEHDEDLTMIYPGTKKKR